MSNDEMEQAIRRLQDSVVILDDLETRLARGARDAELWLEGHEDRLQEHERRLREQENWKQIHEALMQRVEINLAEATEKLDALIKYVAGQNHLPEA